MLNVKKVGVPIAIYGAKHDKILSIIHQRAVRDVLGDAVETYHEINGCH